MQQLFQPKFFTQSFDKQTPHMIYISKVDKKDRNHPRTLHSHSEIVKLILITGGQGNIFIDEEQVPVQKGDLVVYNSGVIHEEFFRNEAVSLYCIGLRGINEKGLQAGELVPEQSSPVFKTGELFPSIVNLFETCYFILEQRKSNYAMIVQQLFETLLILIKTNILLPGNDKSENSEKLAIVQNIKLYMDKNYTEEFKIKNLENNKQWQINPFYFAHKFKDIYGYSPIEYLQRRRIGEAQTLLITTNLSVTEIANSVDFNSSAYFSTIFKKIVSLSPKEYRKQYVKH
ncbi:MULTISPECIES: AraC family transcriptional regulator [Tetragenococcus]|uniref:Ada family regulatory protein n=4 Tax=Tetragenococcus TaxID=51668 RepID=A0A091C405_9ENTE|nr:MULTISPECIES: AraC family transcriptional regulator [Tetragenococcus]GMA47323.1 transcriptional regulator [Tetragenococcus muriaticus]GMA54258.1 transcriptional regulator [Alicyclobacillus contaminans]AYW48410.1 AraC family transcriptional regulator [Tetragenococcus osmophilus]KFN91380.1 Ada family regulatory protein [Tetragenococcus muriaticus 3MR10-3]KFN91837.1 Ada family regulatory protein [Tetragenococcus muriaticus PMC-11-5]